MANLLDKYLKTVPTAAPVTNNNITGDSIKTDDNTANNAIYQTTAQRLNEYAQRFADLPRTAYCGEQYKNFNDKLQPRGLCFVGGDPASGKTSFLLNVVANRIVAHKPTIFLSFEMSAPEIMQRLAAIVSDDTEAQFIHDLKGFIDPETNKPVEQLQYLTMIEPADTINECGAFEVERIAATVENYRTKYEEKKDIMLIIDSLNMLDIDTATDERRAVNTNIRTLSKFTKSHGVTTFCIAQSNRESTKDNNKKFFGGFRDENSNYYDFSSLLYTFRESSLIEYIADCVYYVLKDRADDSNEPNVARHIVSVKHRYQAPNNYVKFEFNRPQFKFKESSNQD